MTKLPAEPRPDHITKIVAEQATGFKASEAGVWAIRVTVASGGGEQFTAKLEGRELVTFAKFRQAILSQHEIWFEGGEYEGRNGKENWSYEIARLRKAGGV